MGRETPRNPLSLQNHQGVPTGETPFSLAYGTEAIIHVDISIPTLCVERVDQDQNGVQLCLILDQSEEKRQAQICIAAYQQQIRIAHHKVKVCEFQVRVLVWFRLLDKRIKSSLGPTRKAPTPSSLEEAKGRTLRLIRTGNSSRSNENLFIWNDIMCRTM